MVRACIIEREGFLDGFAKIYADYDVGFLVNNESYCPGIWRSDEVEVLKRRLKMAEPVLEPSDGEETPAESPAAGP